MIISGDSMHALAVAMSSADQVLNFLNTDIQRACERPVTLPLITHKYLFRLPPVQPEPELWLKRPTPLFKLQHSFVNILKSLKWQKEGCQWLPKALFTPLISLPVPWKGMGNSFALMRPRVRLALVCVASSKWPKACTLKSNTNKDPWAWGTSFLETCISWAEGRRSNSSRRGRLGIDVMDLALASINGYKCQTEKAAAHQWFDLLPWWCFLFHSFRFLVRRSGLILWSICKMTHWRIIKSIFDSIKIKYITVYQTKCKA